MPRSLDAIVLALGHGARLLADAPPPERLLPFHVDFPTKRKPEVLLCSGMISIYTLETGVYSSGKNET